MKFYNTKFRQYREISGLTTEELGEKIGVAGSTITRWETGENTPRPSKISTIAKALSVHISEISDLHVKDDSKREFTKEQVLFIDAYENLTEDQKKLINKLIGK